MTTISGYSSRSLGSKAPIRKPRPSTPHSRSVEKLDVTNVSPWQNNLNAAQIHADTVTDTDELQGPWKLEDIEETSREFATAALSYLQEQGHYFQLVKLGFYQGAVIGNGALFHYNFKAKRADDSSASVQTFFAQLRFFRNPPTSPLERLTVNCCVSLGNSLSLPDERDNCGCGYCTKFVYHPVDGCPGILWGSREKDLIPRKKKRKSRVV
ncbi:uncharacterized protein LOC141643179 [Silene latifolia]|uniref:uncharacterized protein LOC141643179 n=1 Tax=Silene latifolia TaxID=37657 RepID=UPI003D775FC8